MNKKSFILYRDQRNVFEALPPKECKELLLAIFNFADGKNKKLSPLVNIAFLSIKNQLTRDFEKWERNSEMRKEFGRLGGLAKASKNYLKPVLLSKPAVNVNVNVKNKKKKRNINTSPTGVSSKETKSSSLKGIVNYLCKATGVPVTNWAKQGQAFNLCLKAGFNKAQVRWAIDKLVADDFWSSKGIDLTTVLSQLPKLIQADRVTKKKGGNWRDEIKQLPKS